MSRPRLPRPAWVDVVLAAVVTAMGAVEIAVGQLAGPLWATIPSVVMLSIPLLWRRQFPWTALLVAYGTILGLHLVGVDQYNFLASVVSALLILFTFACEVELGQAIAGLVLASAVLIVTVLVGVAGIIWGVGLLLGAWTAGRAIRARRLLIEKLARTTEELRLSREEHARDAVLSERTRIARELHDVIAHSVGVMVVQAGAVERMIPVDPDRAIAAAESVQESGRAALADLRHLLGVLRPDDDEQALGPQPGLGDVPALLDRLKNAGLAVDLRQDGDHRPLPAGVDLAAYRIVQEALTNVLKHAHTSSASLSLAYRDGGLEIEVVNPVAGRRIPGPRADGGHCSGGHGLIGMRERAAMYGGSFSAGPRDDGEFAVRVHLPAGEAATVR